MTDLALLIDVTDVRVLARYVVELTCADNSQRVIDLEPLLWGPMFEPLLADYDLFRQVAVDPMPARSRRRTAQIFPPEHSSRNRDRPSRYEVRARRCHRVS